MFIFIDGMLTIWYILTAGSMLILIWDLSTYKHSNRSGYETCLDPGCIIYGSYRFTNLSFVMSTTLTRYS